MKTVYQAINLDKITKGVSTDREFGAKLGGTPTIRDLREDKEPEKKKNQNGVSRQVGRKSGEWGVLKAIEGSDRKVPLSPLSNAAEISVSWRQELAP